MYRLIALIALTLCVSWYGRALGSADCNWQGVTQGSGCNCFDGFTGSKCETDCGCEAHGTCKGDNTCDCDDGFKWNGNKCVFDCPCSNCIGPNECGCSSACVNGACKNGICICYNGYTGDTCNTLDRDTMPNKDVEVGINLAGISYYSSEVKWVNVFKQSMEWITQREGVSGWNTNEHDKITWRSDGYPASLEDGLRVATLVYRDFGTHEEPGDYVILYDGEGDLGISLAGHTTTFKGKGRWVVNFPTFKDNGIEMLILTTNPSNPVHNIRVLPPGNEYTHERFPYHPVFLEGLSRFSEIRYMDFMHTNGHGPEPTTWASRRTADWYTQTGEKGGALEHMVELSNILGANPWFCIPHAADDNYVKKFAQYVKQNLRQDLNVYVEYSNEVWNGIFRQAQYTKEQGKPLYPDDADFKQGMKYHNLRATEIADMFKSEFGNDGNRIVNVWAWQTGFRDYTRQALEDLGSRKASFNALAITGYFDCNGVVGSDSPGIAHMTDLEIQGWCDDDLPDRREGYTYWVGVAKDNGMKLLMYEGGPGIMENGAIVNGASHDEITNAAMAFHQSDAIQKPVEDVLGVWHDIVVEDSGNGWPGGLFNYFDYAGTPSKYGSWGMLQWTGQKLSDVPKFRGVATHITKYYPNNLIGPTCSLVKESTSYGCYRKSSGATYECGKSTNNGGAWTALSGLAVGNSDVAVLDGVDYDNDKLYVRVLDGTLATPTFYSYSIANSHWTEMDNVFYYSEVMLGRVTPHLPAGGYQGLAAHLSC